MTDHYSGLNIDSPLNPTTHSRLNSLGGLISLMALRDRIKEAMDAAEKSPADLARDTNKTAGAVSQWLDGTIKSIKAETAAAIENATGFRSTWIVTGKGPKRAEDDGTPDTIEYAGLPRAARRVPVVGTAKMGNDGFFDEFSEMPGAGDGHIEIATEDPNAYCLRVRGQSMFPAIRDGWYVLIEPNGTPMEGEYVLVRLRDGRKMVKEFLFRRQQTIELSSVNGGERLSFDYADLDEERGVQSVGSIVPPSKWRPD